MIYRILSCNKSKFNPLLTLSYKLWWSERSDRRNGPVKTESPDSSVSSLSHRTDRTFFRKIPDGNRTTERVQTDNTPMDRHRKGNLDRIQSGNSHRTEFFGKAGQKRDKDRTRAVLSADV